MTYLFPLVRKPRDDILSSHSIAITSLNRHYSILIVTFGWLFYFTQRYRPIFVFSELFSEPTALFSVVFSVVVFVVASIVIELPSSSVPETGLIPHRTRLYEGVSCELVTTKGTAGHFYPSTHLCLQPFFVDVAECNASGLINGIHQPDIFLK